MRQTYLLDTNIISEVTKQNPNENVLSFYVNRKDLCAISAITWQEMIKGFHRMPEGKKKDSINNFINRLEENTLIIPYDKFASQICGELQAKMESKGMPLPFSDSQIAATALSNGMILVTHNTKDFKEIQENSFLQMEDWFA